MGLVPDIDTGLPMSLSLNVYAKYQWQTTAHPTKTNGMATVSK
jgi:nucleoside-specific outer membrane channel protein Tsx